MDGFAAVVAVYPKPIRDLNWTRLDDSGGLSGAVLWRGDLSTRPLFCAKRNPPSADASALNQRQHWLKLAARAKLEFVPRLLPASNGDTLVRHNLHGWEISDWIRGEADFRDWPSRAKLFAACDAVLRLLAAWRNLAAPNEPSRAVRNRLALFAEWEANPVLHSALVPSTHDRVRAVIARHLDRATARLRPWADRPLPCQPCVRDLRHDHFLFEGEELTGLIDYGCTDWDTPATDAARMLGELAGDRPDLYESGIARFAERLGVAGFPPELVRALDLAGTVGSVIHWLDRLRHGPTASGRMAGIECRVIELVERLENGFGWS